MSAAAVQCCATASSRAVNPGGSRAHYAGSVGWKIGCHSVRVVTSGLGEDSYWETSFGWIHTGNYFGYIVISFHSLRPRDTSRVLPVDWTVCPVTLVAEPTKGSRCQQRAKPVYWAD